MLSSNKILRPIEEIKFHSLILTEPTEKSNIVQAKIKKKCIFKIKSFIQIIKADFALFLNLIVQQT